MKPRATHHPAFRCTHAGIGDQALRSAVPEIRWPAWPVAEDADLIALAYQLDASQWWPRQRLLSHQLAQIEQLMAYARSAVPFYATRLPAPGRRLTLAGLRDLPILRRTDIHAAGAALITRALPLGHAPLEPVATSGSTGRPITTLTTSATRALYRAFNLRMAVWHGLDPTAKLASIRPSAHQGREPEREQRYANWLPAMEGGPVCVLDVQTTTAEQLSWLRGEAARYLQCYPSVLDSIAQHAQAAPGLGFDRALTFGEPVDDRLRSLCQRVFGAPILDCYSTIECGMLAIQCPQSGLYHVMAEGALVEILDDQDRACRPGQVGRVVVTVLANFATPLIRYDLGDLAEVGGLCPCGRGLPTLARIQGRTRNLLTLPDGTRRWPFVHPARFAGTVPLQQFQIAQIAPDALEARLVPSRPFTEREQNAFVQALIDAVGYPFRITLRFVQEIPRGPGGKFEDFLGLASVA